MKLYCKYGAFVYCDAMSVDNIYSIDIDEKDKVIEFNDFHNFPIAWVTGYDTVEDVSFIRYDEEGDLNCFSNCIIENGKLIYNGDDVYED